MALSHRGHRAPAGEESPGFGAANPTQLQDLACLVWLAGKHRLPWLAPCATRVHGAGQAAKIPKDTGESHILRGDRVVDAKAREAALLGKRLKHRLADS